MESTQIEKDSLERHLLREALKYLIGHITFQEVIDAHTTINAIALSDRLDIKVSVDQLSVARNVISQRGQLSHVHGFFLGFIHILRQCTE